MRRPAAAGQQPAARWRGQAAGAAAGTPDTTGAPAAPGPIAPIARALGVDRDTALLVAANLLWGIGSGLYAAIWPLFVQRLGASPVQIGLALSLTTACSIVVFIPGATIARRLGRKRAMALGWLMGPASSVVFGLATTWEQLLPGIVILALVGLQTPAYLGYIARNVANRDLPRVYSLMASAVSVGTVLSSPLGGWLADATDMRLLFWGVGGAYGVSLLCVLALDEQPDAPAPPAPGGLRRALAGYGALLTDGALLRPLGIQLLLLAAANLAQPLAVNWLVAAYGYSLSQIGILGAVAALASVGWASLLGRIAARRGTPAAVLTAAALVALGAVSLLAASTLLVGVLAHVLRGAFSALRALSNGVAASVLRPVMEPATTPPAEGPHTRPVDSAASADRRTQTPPRRVRHTQPGHVERGFAVYSTLLNAVLALSTFAAGALYQVDPVLPFAFSALGVVPVAVVLGLSAAGARWGRPVIRLRRYA
jgi:predicted MFS family arabinose efflux permease